MKKLIFLFGLMLCLINTIKSQKYIDTLGNVIYTKVDSVAKFCGGDTAWAKFLNRRLNSYTAAENGAPNGTYVVVISFIVKKDGGLIDIKGLTHIGFGLEEECIKFMKRNPKWIPAKFKKRVVNSLNTLSFTFVAYTPPQKPFYAH